MIGWWLTTAVAGTLTVDAVEDVDGDGTLADAVPLDVLVTVYRDDGDGIPNAGDLAAPSFSSSTSASLADGVWWVTVAPVVGGDVLEQTTSDAGGWCGEDHGAPIERTDAGPCFGGRRGGVADAPGLVNAEHVVRVDLLGTEALSMGFSRNVVTHTGAGQGSLDAYLGMATGRMRFTPAVPAVGLQWVVDPVVRLWTDVEVDGAAWCDGTACALGSRRNLAPVVSGESAQGVGLGSDGRPTTGDELALAPNDSGELVIGGTSLIELGSGALITDLVRIDGGLSITGTDVVIEGLVAGRLADGTRRTTGTITLQSAGARVRDSLLDGVSLVVEGNGASVVRSRFLGDSGIGIRSVASTLTLTENLVSGWTVGVSAEAGGLEFEGGTLSDNAVGLLAVDGNLEVVVRSSRVVGNTTSGVMVGRGVLGVVVDRSSFAGNGLAVDLLAGVPDPLAPVADGVSANDGLAGGLGNDGQDAPTITDVRRSTSAVRVLGVVGPIAAAVPSVATIDCYQGADDGDVGPDTAGSANVVSYAEPDVPLGRCEALSTGYFDCVFAASVAQDMPTVCLATTAGNTSEGGASFVTGPLDEDLDGLDTVAEIAAGTDPTEPDTDGDGLEDGDPRDPDPTMSDTDGDGLSDGHEVAAGIDPTDADTDDDGVEDADEAALGTDPFDADSDDDGLSDGEELLTDPTLIDTDGDGVQDGTELGRVPPLFRGFSTGRLFYLATDSDVFQPDQQSSTRTDPAAADTDGDGLLDGEEDVNGNGVQDLWLSLSDGPVRGESDPNRRDSDGDGLEDDEERARGTSPVDADTDLGGVSDGVEVAVDGTDPLDGSDDVSQLDSDADWLTDLEELAGTTDPFDPDSDDDGLFDGREVLIHRTDPNDPDTDGGGLPDGFEVDFGGNPLDPSDDLVAGRYRGGCSTVPGSSFVLWGMLIGFIRRRRGARRAR